MGKDLLGVEASELRSIAETDDSFRSWQDLEQGQELTQNRVMNDFVNSKHYKQATFVIRAKSEPNEEAPRINYYLAKLETIDYKEEAKMLMKELRLRDEK